MAHAAVVSLKHTINRLLNPRTSIAPAPVEILHSAFRKTCSLLEVLDSLDDSRLLQGSQGLEALQRQIREAAHQLEDVLETHVSTNLLSAFRDENSFDILSLDFEEVKPAIDSFVETARRFKNAWDLLGDEDFHLSIYGDQISKRMEVGVSNLAWKIISELTDESPKLRVLSLYERPLFGKTALARSIFNDPSILRLFERRVWVTIGHNYQFNDILKDILAQVNPDHQMFEQGYDDEIIGLRFYTCLKDWKCLIVLDDMRNKLVWHNLKRLLLDEDNGSRVLVTTRLSEVAYFVARHPRLVYRARLLDPEESVKLLHEKIFGDRDLCPDELEVPFYRTVGSCNGRRFDIAVAANILSKAEKGYKSWIRAEGEVLTVSSRLRHQILQIEKVLNLQSSYSVRDEGKASPLENDFRLKKWKMDKLCDEARQIKDMLLHGSENVSIVGMAGIGKTTLAEEVFEDPSIMLQFEQRAWVTLGPGCFYLVALKTILAQVNHTIEFENLQGIRCESIDVHLRRSLIDVKYLIVLDDLWDSKIWNELRKLLPDNNNGSRVLVTTRLNEVADSCAQNVHKMRFLNKEESWDLLRQRVFAEESCSIELEKVGKKIAENCDGLPLTIVTVAAILSKTEKTLKYWKKVSEKKSLVFKNAYNKLLKVLSPSYDNLPQILKAWFLYLGVFPQNYEIPYSRLLNLLSAEDFVEDSPPSFENHAQLCLFNLASRNLLMIQFKNYGDGDDYEYINSCWLHSAFWHLSMTRAFTDRFFHRLNTLDDGLEQSIEIQRRLCFLNNVLFGIEAVRESVESAVSARSLLCTGPYLQYPVPVCFSLMLLRVLDALSIRFYEFPEEIVNLVQLRYLALTCNGELPPSVSKLLNLEYLIVHRHHNIKINRDQVYMPMEIWDMKELKHLQVMGSDLPAPGEGNFLPNLEALLDVSAHSCTKEVLERMPKLTKLAIRIELPPYATKPSRCFDHVSHLHQLVSLKCVVVNPELRFRVIALPDSLPIFPYSLSKLNLSGLGLPWGCMSILGSLPNLVLLNLQCYAFRGPKWEIQNQEFSRLEILLLEDTDLEYWSADEHCLRRLRHITIKHCFKLKYMLLETVRRSCQMELVHCNASFSKRMENYQWVKNLPVI